jgi:hypothetical protein
MGQFTDWWLNRPANPDRQIDWELPISSVQKFRPVGGYLIGTSTTLEFEPNRFEALIGGTPWVISREHIQQLTLGRRRLQIVTGGDDGSRTLFTNRPATIRRHLQDLLPH